MHTYIHIYMHTHNFYSDRSEGCKMQLLPTPTVMPTPQTSTSAPKTSPLPIPPGTYDVIYFYNDVALSWTSCYGREINTQVWAFALHRKYAPRTWSTFIMTIFLFYMLYPVPTDLPTKQSGSGTMIIKTISSLGNYIELLFSLCSRPFTICMYTWGIFIEKNILLTFLLTLIHHSCGCLGIEYMYLLSWPVNVLLLW